MTDEERLNWLEKITEEGYCPAILNDDNGHWAVTFDGVQNVTMSSNPEDLHSTFFVEAKYWKSSIREAIDYMILEITKSEGISPSKKTGWWGRYLERLNKVTGGKTPKCCD